MVAGVPKRTESAPGGDALPEEAAQVVRLVGSKTFLLQDGVWIDTAFDPSQMTTMEVGFGTESYFDLLSARPAWGDYMALGERVIFVAEGKAYEVVLGEGGPVEIPPARTPEPGESTPEPGQPTPEPAQPGKPTATPDASGGTTPTEPGGTICTGAMVMGLVALAAAVLWQRLRG